MLMNNNESYTSSSIYFHFFDATSTGRRIAEDNCDPDCTLPFIDAEGQFFVHVHFSGQGIMFWT
jgi:hypothetical protein